MHKSNRDLLFFRIQTENGENKRATLVKRVGQIRLMG